MNHSTPGLPVHHHLPEFTQIHVHRVSDAIQPSHPLSSPSPAPNPSQRQSFPMSQLFAWGGQSPGVSASASFLPKKSQGWSPSEWTGWISFSLKIVIKLHFYIARTQWFIRKKEEYSDLEQKRKFINSKSLVLLTSKLLYFPFYIPITLINILPGA